VIDNQDQSILMDTRRVHRPATATLNQWITNERFDFVDGAHDGYERLANPIIHRRQVFFVKPEYWVVIDHLTGRGRHCFDLYFHLATEADPQLDSASKSLYTGGRSKPGLAIVPLALPELEADVIVGETAPIQGWVSLYSGEKLPAPTLRYRQETHAPVQFCTVLYPFPAGNRMSVSVDRLKVDGPNLEIKDDAGPAIGICVQTATFTDYLVMDQRTECSPKEFAGYETDAQLAYVRQRKDDNHSKELVITTGGRSISKYGKPIGPSDPLSFGQF
jgi:hypothetical protein